MSLICSGIVEMSYSRKCELLKTIIICQYTKQFQQMANERAKDSCYYNKAGHRLHETRHSSDQLTYICRFVTNGLFISNCLLLLISVFSILFSPNLTYSHGWVFEELFNTHERTPLCLVFKEATYEACRKLTQNILLSDSLISLLFDIFLKDSYRRNH